MKRLLTVLSLCTTFAMGQVTSIADIQYVADPGTDDTSPLADSTVTISGIVTAEFWGSYKNRTMFIQDADTAWSGIALYEGGGWDAFATTYDAGVNRTTIVEGDSITLTATVGSYSGGTQMVSATSLVVHGLATNPPAPILVTPGTGNAEKYEGVLITVSDVDIAAPD